MPRLVNLRRTPAVLAALLLAGCWNASPDSDAAPVSDNPEFVDLLNDARGELRSDNLTDARRLLNEARTMEPKNPALWVEIARLRFRGADHYKAIEAADYALKLAPDYAPALFLRAQLVRDANGLSEALAWYEAAVTADPANPEVLADYAATLGDLGRNRDMLKVVREIQDISPGYPQVYFLQAVLAARAGDTVLARSLLARSGMFQKGVPSAVLLDALIDLQQRTPDTALTTLDKLAQRQPANARIRELIALALWQGGRDDDLIARFGSAATAPDATPYLTMLVGRALERRGDRAQAAPLIERALTAREVQLVALSSFTDLPEPTARLRTMVRAQDIAGAQREAANMLSRYPGSSDALAFAGDAALIVGDPKAAIAHYTQSAVVRRPWLLTRKIIYTTRALGDAKAADALLIRAVVGEPRNTEALLMLAQRRAEVEDWERVAKLANLVFALGAGNDPTVLSLQARAAEELGRTRQATNWDLTAEAIQPGRFVRRN